jgi:predicted nucleic acid-binding protein
LADAPTPLIADASVWINLVATGRIEAHLSTLHCSISITSIALRELERGRVKGRQTADKLSELIRSDRVLVEPFSSDTGDIFMTLVSGPASETLDDGEAATLTCALASKARAVIDERKATAIAARRFPQLAVISTTDLLLHPTARIELGEEITANSIFKALQNARMRVPEHHLQEVCLLLGPERTSQCLSLPVRVRTRNTVSEGLR